MAQSLQVCGFPEIAACACIAGSCEEGSGELSPLPSAVRAPPSVRSPPPSTPPVARPAAEQDAHTLGPGAIAGIAVGATAAVLAMGALLVLLLRRRARGGLAAKASHPTAIASAKEAAEPVLDVKVEAQADPMHTRPVPTVTL